jgi:hypothetical protein
MDEATEVDTDSKPLRPDQRREQTDIAFRGIVTAEADERHAKSERLRLAREAQRGI